MSKELIERLKNEGDGVMSRREKTMLANRIEELEREVASRDAEVAELKSVPMKYRRMAFNAKLQDEISELRKFVQEQDELLQECRPIIKTAENVRKERDQLREQVKMLREALRDCAYDEGGFCINPDAAEALAATEPKK